MNLSKKIIVSSVLTLLFWSCQENKRSDESINNQSEKNEEQQTYAEISVKEGGSWENGKYVGGSFTNVTELKLPKEHNDKSGFLRYEGPGWENSRVGYRLYLDWRNAIDIFGKKEDTMVLHQVGFPGQKSYHDEAPWGMDILKAGESLGLGGFGRYLNDTVAHFREMESTVVNINNNETFSEVIIDYKNWTTGDETIDLHSSFSIYPDDRYTKVELNPSAEVSGLCTGIVKFQDIPLMQKENKEGNWGYIATYGNQTLAGENDKLGMAIFYNKNEVEKTVEGPHDHLVIFAPEAEITYFFLAAWEQEKDGIKTQDDFVADLDQKLALLEKEGRL